MLMQHNSREKRDFVRSTDGLRCAGLDYGRFMQTDPIGYEDGLNWYNYVEGDPVNATDPTGTNCVSQDSGRGYTTTDDQGNIKVAIITQQVCWDGGAGGGSLGTVGVGAGGGSGRPQESTIDDVVVTAQRPCGLFCKIGRLLGRAGRATKSAVCSLPSITLGGGADGYAGIGGSVGGSYNFDFSKGRFGASASLGVGVGLGIDAGPNVGAGPSGGGIVSANLAGTAGFAAPVGPGVNVGTQATYNFIGTDRGFSGAAIGRAGTPLAYANLGANIGLSTPRLYNLGC